MMLYRTNQVTLPDPDGEGGQAAPEYNYVYDAAGQLTRQTDPLGRETSYVYDDLGRTITVIEPDPDGEGEEESPETTYTYDAAGKVLSVTDPLGKTTDYTYDNLGRLITTELPDPDGQGSLGRPTTSYSYDAAGNVTSLTDPVGNTTAWVYDGLDRVIEETNELEDTRYFSYDAASRLVERTDRNGRVTEYGYDNLGRMIEERWVDGQTTLYTANYTYDAASRLLTAADDFSSYEYTYDGLGRVTLIESDNGGPVVKFSQGFDAAGNRTVLSSQVDVGSGFDDDFVNTYTYDNLGRLTRVEQQGVQGGNAVAEKRVDFAYNAASQYASIARYDDLDGGSGNEVATTAYGYDGIGRLTSLAHTHDTTEIADYAWTYDAFSRVTSMSFDSLVGDNGSSTYSYDDTDQLTAADHDFQTDEGYEFDENGNRTMDGYDIGANNQLLSDGTFDYQYDAEGNRILRTRISTDPADDYITEYEWDYHNRLTKITYKNNEEEITKEVEYTYDVFNRRIAKSIDWDGAGEDDPVGVEYVYDVGWDILLAFNGESSLTNRYLHGPGEDNILADEQFSPEDPGEMPSAPGDLFWMLADNLGSVRDIVDSDGNVENHLTYDGFGNVTSETNPNFNAMPGFQGTERDEESGLNHANHRDGDPHTGGWLKPDPLGLGPDTNPYRFIGNGPTNGTDPSGLWTKEGLIAILKLTPDGQAMLARMTESERKGELKLFKADLRYKWTHDVKAQDGLPYTSKECERWTDSFNYGFAAAADGVIYLHDDMSDFIAAWTLMHEGTHFYQVPRKDYSRDENIRIEFEAFVAEAKWILQRQEWITRERLGDNIYACYVTRGEFFKKEDGRYVINEQGIRDFIIRTYIDRKTKEGYRQTQYAYEAPPRDDERVYLQDVEQLIKRLGPIDPETGMQEMPPILPTGGNPSGGAVRRRGGAP
jgi:RHS repeat-associated protein